MSRHHSREPETHIEAILLDAIAAPEGGAAIGVSTIEPTRSGMQPPTDQYETDAETSKRMSAVRPGRTSLENIVASVLVELGVSFVRSRHDLPGRPDFLIETGRKVIFAHGCYWHRHAGCRRATMPKRNKELWAVKFEKTVLRDERNEAALVASGFDVLVVWECETKDLTRLTERIKGFLADVKNEK